MMNSTRTIPPILHQTWKDRAVPERYLSLRRTWREFQPNWDYRLWTDAEILEFIGRHYPWFLPIYRRYPRPIFCADVMRYFVMHHFGGVYVDLDFECLRPIDGLLEGRELVLGLEPTGHVGDSVRAAGLDRIVCNAFIASRPGHPFWVEVFRRLTESCREPSPLDATGPFFLTRVCRSYGEADGLTIVGSDFLYPATKNECWEGLIAAGPSRARILRDAYACHHWEGTWWRSPSTESVLGSRDAPGLRPASEQATRAGRDDAPRILILTPLKDAARFLPRYWDNLRKLTYPHDRIAVGLLEGDSRDGTFEQCAGRLKTLNIEFARAALWKSDCGFHPAGPRWAPSIQYRRRSILAKCRNNLLHRALDDEDWVLWMDVDLVEYPPDIIERLLATGKDIVCPHCVTSPGGGTFDLNTFQSTRDLSGPEGEPYLIDGILQPPKGVGRRYLDGLRDQELVRVDSVGGTMLLIRADIHREGLMFPPFAFGRLIETEGLALMATAMGYECWGLPNVEVIHAR